MFSGRPRGAIAYPPSKKFKHSPTYSTDHSSHGRENVHQYAGGTQQPLTSSPFEEPMPSSSPCQSRGLITSQEDFLVSANQDWRHVSAASMCEKNHESAHFPVDPCYWQSFGFQDIESMHDPVDINTAWIQGQAQQANDLSDRSSLSLSNTLLTSNGSFGSAISSRIEEQSIDTTTSSSISYFDDFSAGASTISRPACSSFVSRANDSLTPWGPANIINDPDFENEFSQPEIQVASGLGSPGPEKLSLFDRSLSQRPSTFVDSVICVKHLERSPLMPSKSFGVSEDITLAKSEGNAKGQWQIMLSLEDLPHKSGRRYRPSKPPIQKQRKSGCRAGPLKPENAKKASEMRRRRACWSCWLSKIPCSMEDECYHCSNNRPSLFHGIICSRRQLADYTNLFFPAALVSHLQLARLENMIEDEVASFMDTTIKITISSGTLYPSMELTLRRFISSNKDFLAVDVLNEDCEGRLIAVRKCAPPVGLPTADVILLKKKCLQHIKGIVASSLSPREYVTGEEPDLSWRILEAIDRFRKASRRPEIISILQKSLMLHAMHAFMGRSLTVVNAEEFSASFTTVHHLDEDYDFGIPPPLLNREIKHVMNSLIHETTEHVLGQLERELRTKSKVSWAPCLCTILILSLCAEDLQVALDGFAVYTLLHPSRKSPLSRTESLALARQIDDRLLADCKALFHGIYKSRKRSTGQKSEKGFNPIRDGLDVDGDDMLGQEVHDLVEDIHNILGTYAHTMTEWARQPSFSDNDREDIMDSHIEFRKRNSGRLVSQFLRSFLETPA